MIIIFLLILQFIYLPVGLPLVTYFQQTTELHRKATFRIQQSPEVVHNLYFVQRYQLFIVNTVTITPHSETFQFYCLTPPQKSDTPLSETIPKNQLHLGVKPTFLLIQLLRLLTSINHRCQWDSNLASANLVERRGPSQCVTHCIYSSAVRSVFQVKI